MVTDEFVSAKYGESQISTLVLTVANIVSVVYFYHNK